MTKLQAELLVADIGATNARFARYVGGVRRAENVFATSEHSDGVELVRTAAETLGLERPAACCFAVAGPVRDGVGALTNQGLVFEQTAIAANLALPRVSVINDLVALAHSSTSLDAAAVRQIGGAAGRSGGVRAVIAPGTGLGMAVVHTFNGEPHCVPSEGGHSPFAPADPLEQEILGVLSGREGYVSWETVLSGPGLVNLYQAVCHVWGSAPETIDARRITERALSVADPVCHQSLSLFCSILGSAAGMLAVTACADGGIYIGGGIVPQIVDFVIDSGFRRRFEERGVLTEYVRAIPVFAIMDDSAALDGAARYAAGSLARQ